MDKTNETDAYRQLADTALDVSSLLKEDLEQEMEEGLSTFQQDESLTIINYHKGSSKNCQFPLLLWRRKG